MARPFFPHEAYDPDLDWLESNFLYERPDFVPVETGMLPLVLIPYKDMEGTEKIREQEDEPVVAPETSE